MSLYNIHRKRVIVMDEKQNEATIVLRAQAGDEEAFEWLVKKYEKLIYYIAMQRVKDGADAMDIVQETLIEMKKSLAQLQEPRYFKAWLNKVAFSKISRFYEKRRDRILSQKEEQLLHQQSESRYYMNPQESFHYENNKELLNACLAQLKGIYREVLVLQYFEGFTLNEIADILDIPEGTVKSRANMAKKELRKIVEQFQEQEQVHITFDSIGWEALLGVVFEEQFRKLVYPGTPKIAVVPKRWKLIQPKLLINTLMCSIAGVSLAVGIHGVLQHPFGNTPTTFEQTPEEVTTIPFPHVVYQGEIVPDARAAYASLYHAAYGKETIDQQEVKKLYDVLINYGGAYAEMAEFIKDDLEING